MPVPEAGRREGRGGVNAAPICVRVDRALSELNIGKTKLYELLASGELEAIRIGRRTLVLQDSIDALVERLRSSRLIR
ncbi:MAG: helix-turn-helix domain-containing protein [Novosphingobium sp.]|nr:helix-turn-helix domain-containing protein [Novosphingobium sp.]